MEREISNRNWRDAFEDLLALNAGRDMIHPQSRRAEDDKAAKIRYNFANDYIQTYNTMQRRSLKFQEKMMEKRRAYVDDGHTKHVILMDKMVFPYVKSKIETSLVAAQSQKAAFEAERHAKASYLKRPGHWIASLITNGAVPGWQSVMKNGVDGPVLAFERRDAPPELDAQMAFSERELEGLFRGQEYKLGIPPALPSDVVNLVVDSTSNTSKGRLAVGVIRRCLPNPSSIILQRSCAELIKLHDGSIGAKAYIVNQLADRHVENKEFLEEPAKVFEEMEHARQSMQLLGQAVVEHMQRPRDSFQDLVDGRDD